MSLRIDLSEIADAILQNEAEAFVVEAMDDMANGIFVDLTAPPPTGTPVDSGAARNSWQVDTSDRLHPEVTSDSPYMNRLNNGHSQQSPSGFIDAVVDKWTR